MGSLLEFNDTLQLTTEQGFPADLFDLARHRRDPITVDLVAGKVFRFRNKPGPWIFHLDPVRVYWFHNLEGRWLAWGQILVRKQIISKSRSAARHERPINVSDPSQWVTAGEYTVLKIFDPEYQEQFTRNDLPAELSYFG